MLPEIALTTQITERLKRVFGNRLGIYHSKFPDAERVEIWRKQLTDDDYDVILGVIGVQRGEQILAILVDDLQDHQTVVGIVLVFPLGLGGEEGLIHLPVILQSVYKFQNQLFSVLVGHGNKGGAEIFTHLCIPFLVLSVPPGKDCPYCNGRKR